MLLKRNKKILIYVFLFFMLGTLNNKNFSSFNFQNIINIEVDGLSKDQNDKISNELKFLNLSSLFNLNSIKIEKILNSNNLIESYSIFKRYPAILKIKIVQAKFLANINKQGKSFLLGSNGKLIKVKNQKKELPYIFGDFDNQSFFVLLKSIQNSKIQYSEIQNLYYFTSGRWDLEMKSGTLIKLPKKELLKSLNLSAKLLSNKKFKKKKLIDLRQNNQVITNE